MNALQSHYKGKRVLLTGHTGFKGAWLSEWLLSLHANVIGVSLPPNTTPSLFEQLELEKRIEHHYLNINDHQALVKLIVDVKPDIVFHLAAQPLVRYSYKEPLETFTTNVLGTVHVLEGVRHINKSCEVVIITTDKCYENLEQTEPYCEDDRMGGHDPYSASKGAAELIVASYRRSFFDPKQYGKSHHVSLASARAGNVIGGGDWAVDRIVPDCIRTLSSNGTIKVRNAFATRPWQHVLEPLGGYLLLAYELAKASTSQRRIEICGGFNFGPHVNSVRPVKDVVNSIIEHWPGNWQNATLPNAVHEATLLSLNINKAQRLLNWRPIWEFEDAISYTTKWYRDVHEERFTAFEKTQSQIKQYTECFYREI